MWIVGLRLPHLDAWTLSIALGFALRVKFGRRQHIQD
jgi:hypothetical protein